MDETMQHIVEKETEGGVAVDETAGAAAVAAAVVMASPGKAKDTKDISGTLTIRLLRQRVNVLWLSATFE